MEFDIFKLQPCLPLNDSAHATRTIVLVITELIISNFKELQSSKIHEERASASSLFFTMVEAALRAQPHLQPRDPALALTSASSCLLVQSLRNLNELQGSRIDEE